MTHPNDVVTHHEAARMMEVGMMVLFRAIERGDVPHLAKNIVMVPRVTYTVDLAEVEKWKVTRASKFNRSDEALQLFESGLIMESVAEVMGITKRSAQTFVSRGRKRREERAKAGIQPIHSSDVSEQERDGHTETKQVEGDV